MHRDPILRKRNALVIPGVLLVLLCLAGILYAQLLRPDDATCEDGRQVFFLDACRSATLLLVLPLALGAVLIGLGARLRSHEPCRLGHGTASTTGLAILVAAFALPAIAALALSMMEDPEDPYVVTYNEVDYGQPAILGAVAGIGLLLLLPYLLLYIGTSRPPRCCRDKSCFEPCYCDEDAAAPVPTFPLAAPLTRAPLPPPGETAQVTTTPWRGPPAREVTPLPPAPKAAPVPAAPAAPPPVDVAKPLEHDAWPATGHAPPANVPAEATFTAAEPAGTEPTTTEPTAEGAQDDKPHRQKPKKAKTTRKVTRKKKA